MKPALQRAGFRPLVLFGRRILLRPAALKTAALLAAVLAGLALCGVLLGTVSVPAAAIIHALTDGGALSDRQWLIVGELRLPRVLMATLCGAMLGMAGAAMQSIARNGLADPGLIGVKEGASIAVLILVLFFPAVGAAWRPLAGLAGGAGVTLVVVTLAGDLSRPRFILIGIGISWLLAAAIGIFMTTADVRDVQTALMWLAGSLQAASWPLLAIALAWALPAAAVLLLTARAADIALLGAHTAAGLGVRLVRLTWVRLFATVLLTSASVSCVGGLGFVGLIAPHISRLVLRGGQTALLCGSGLTGALLVLAADNLGRLLFAPLQIPAGIVIAFAGGPFFLFLLWRRRDAL